MVAVLWSAASTTHLFWGNARARKSTISLLDGMTLWQGGRRPMGADGMAVA
jgi:hypothetical protein